MLVEGAPSEEHSPSPSIMFNLLVNINLYDNPGAFIMKQVNSYNEQY